jgi:hypothetical protein
LRSKMGSSKMGSDQISGHGQYGDSAAITKICSDPTLRLTR